MYSEHKTVYINHSIVLWEIYVNMFFYGLCYFTFKMGYKI